jgi:hypothetical protein
MSKLKTALVSALMGDALDNALMRIFERREKEHPTTQKACDKIRREEYGRMADAIIEDAETDIEKELHHIRPKADHDLLIATAPVKT